MFAVIPAHNEETRILTAIRSVRQAGIKRILVVINGCQDNTREVVLSVADRHMTLLTFRDALGVDIPRAIGAAYAYTHGADHVLFYDGDLIGHHQDELAKMIDSAQRFKIDLGLTDIYGTAHDLDLNHDLPLKLRHQLSHKLGLYSRIGLSTPAHGPHIMSRRLIREMPITDLALPPLTLYYAKKYNLKIDVLAHIAQARLGSAHRDSEHVQRIRDTLIGDLMEAIHLHGGLPRKRVYRGTSYDGYHSARRFDLLHKFIRSLSATKLK